MSGDETARQTHGLEESQESPSHDTSCDDDMGVPRAEAPLDDEDVHMRGSQEGPEAEQPYLDTQASQAGGDTLFVDTEGLYDFTDARPEPVPMVTSPAEGGTAGTAHDLEEVTNL